MLKTSCYKAKITIFGSCLQHASPSKHDFKYKVYKIKPENFCCFDEWDLLLMDINSLFYFTCK